METPLTPEDSLALLRENASRLASVADGQPAGRLGTAPGPDEWSPVQVLAHIRACCDVWGGNIGRILAEEHPTFPGMNPRSWINRTDYPDTPFDAALSAFAVERDELLRRLDGLKPADWDRCATVTSYGQAHEKTVRFYASKLARHERIHVRQIEQSLAAMAGERAS